MIFDIEIFLPKKVLTNRQISQKFPEYSVEKIGEKIGINERKLVGDNEFATDLAINASKMLFKKANFNSKEIDYILYCTQSPEYIIPTNACLIQHKLDISTNAGAIDINQGCSGYIYGLSLAKGLLASNQANNILLITSDTYSLYIDENDKSNRTIFGDGSSATLIRKVGKYKIGEFILGSDGSGFEHLILKNSGLKGFNFKKPELYMNGPKIFEFTIKIIPTLIKEILDKNNSILEEIDAFIFHQANKFMLEHLRKKIKIPKEKFMYSMENTGNTVSSTIPIVLKNIQHKNYRKILICGFGVGLSWGGTILSINDA